MRAETLNPEQILSNGPFVRVAPERPLKALSLKSNFLWTLAGNGTYAACQWGMLIVLAKVVSAQLVGQFALGFAITAPVIMLANMQLRGVQATDARNEYRFSDYMALRLATTAIAFLVIVALTGVVGYGGNTVPVILAIGLAKSFEAISDVIYGLMQKHERMDRIAVSMMLKGPASLVVLGVLVWTTRNILYGVLGLAGVWLAILLVYDLPRARQLAPLRPRFDRSILWCMASVSMPLGIAMSLVSLNINIPRYFLERLTSENELGYFAAMASIMTIGSVVVAALGQSASPRLAKEYAAGRQYAFQRLVLLLLGIGVGFGVLGWSAASSFGRDILIMLYRPEYAERVGVLVWLMLAAGLSYVASFLGYSMTAARYFRSQVPLFVLVAISSVIACAVLIPVNGILGAAQATTVAAIVQLVGSAVINAHALFALSRRDAKEACT